MNANIPGMNPGKASMAWFIGVHNFIDDGLGYSVHSLYNSKTIRYKGKPLIWQIIPRYVAFNHPDLLNWVTLWL